MIRLEEEPPEGEGEVDAEIAETTDFKVLKKEYIFAKVKTALR